MLQTSHLPECPKSYTGPRVYEERGFTDLVTLGCGGGFRSAPGSPTATYENRETRVGELDGKPAFEVAKPSKTTTQAELAGNTRKALEPVTWRSRPDFFEVRPTSGGGEFFSDQTSVVGESTFRV